jgi:addiction module RelE/StbE family toxin
MTRIRWTRAAADDLEQIKNYLLQHYPAFAQPTVLRIYEDILMLKKFPLRGRTGREEGTRELVFSGLPYVAVYRTKENTIEVLRIYHGAQGRTAL